jgi:hypothetical protein
MNNNTGYAAPREFQGVSANGQDMAQTLANLSIAVDRMAALYQTVASDRRGMAVDNYLGVSQGSVLSGIIGSVINNRVLSGLWGGSSTDLQAGLQDALRLTPGMGIHSTAAAIVSSQLTRDIQASMFGGGTGFTSYQGLDRTRMGEVAALAGNAGGFSDIVGGIRKATFRSTDSSIAVLDKELAELGKDGKSESAAYKDMSEYRRKLSADLADGKTTAVDMAWLDSASMDKAEKVMARMAKAVAVASKVLGSEDTAEAFRLLDRLAGVNTAIDPAAASRATARLSRMQSLSTMGYDPRQLLQQQLDMQSMLEQTTGSKGYAAAVAEEASEAIRMSYARAVEAKARNPEKFAGRDPLGVDARMAMKAAGDQSVIVENPGLATWAAWSERMATPQGKAAFESMLGRVSGATSPEEIQTIVRGFQDEFQPSYGIGGRGFADALELYGEGGRAMGFMGAEGQERLGRLVNAYSEATQLSNLDMVVGYDMSDGQREAVKRLVKAVNTSSYDVASMDRKALAEATGYEGARLDQLVDDRESYMALDGFKREEISRRSYGNVRYQWASESDMRDRKVEEYNGLVAAGASQVMARREGIGGFLEGVLQGEIRGGEDAALARLLVEKAAVPLGRMEDGKLVLDGGVSEGRVSEVLGKDVGGRLVLPDGKTLSWGETRAYIKKYREEHKGFELKEEKGADGTPRIVAYGPGTVRRDGESMDKAEAMDYLEKYREAHPGVEIRTIQDANGDMQVLAVTSDQMREADKKNRYAFGRSLAGTELYKKLEHIGSADPASYVLDNLDKLEGKELERLSAARDAGVNTSVVRTALEQTLAELDADLGKAKGKKAEKLSDARERVQAGLDALTVPAGPRPGVSEVTDTAMYGLVRDFIEWVKPRIFGDEV